MRTVTSGDADNEEKDKESNNESSDQISTTRQRPRFTPVKVNKFEGISEENEDQTSRSSDEVISKDKKEQEEEAKEQVSELRDTEQKEEKPPRSRLTSEGSTDEAEAHQRSILKGSRIRPILERHLSFDDSNNKPEHKSDDQDAIDRYYEKNNYTVTGGMFAKNQDTFRNLPEYLRRDRLRIPPDTVSQKSRQSLRPPPSSGEVTKKRFRKSFYWLAHNRKKYGFRHIVFLFLAAGYTFLGAAVFYFIETKHELETVTSRKAYLDATMLQIAADISEKVNDPLTQVNVSIMEEYIRSAYIKLLTLESAYEGSTLHKMEDPENNFKWTFSSSFFYSMNVYTTTGYGSIAPETVEGKVCTIIYGFLFVPLTLVVIRDLGQMALVYITKFYAILLIKLRNARGLPEGKDDEIITLPIKLSLSILFGYLLFAATFIYEYDALSGPPDTGMDYFNCFYFSFISMTTIGLGDIMPNNVPFAPIISIMFFFGLPIMKVINRVTYVCVENGVFGTITVLENRLDSILSGDLVVVDPETGVRSRAPSIRSQSISRKSTVEGPPGAGEESSEEEGEIPNEWLNNFTIRSIATFMRANGDVYGGGFGRVNLRRGDLLPGSNQNTVMSNR